MLVMYVLDNSSSSLEQHSFDVAYNNLPTVMNTDDSLMKAQLRANSFCM